MFFSNDWRLNLCIFIVIFVILWIVIGRSDDCEFVGLRPLLEKTEENEESLSHQISFSISDESESVIENPHSLDNLVDNTSQEPGEKIEEEVNSNVEVRHHSLEEYMNRMNNESNPEIPDPMKQSIESKRWKGEEYCCMALESVVGHKVLRNVRPSFLKNPESNRNLELDCYDPETNLAVEYNGIQHYEYPNTFHRDEKTFQDQVYRDVLKNDLCQRNGITLITVPYTVDEKIPSKLRYSTIYNYIRSHFG